MFILGGDECEFPRRYGFSWVEVNVEADGLDEQYARQALSAHHACAIFLYVHIYILQEVGKGDLF